MQPRFLLVFILLAMGLAACSGPSYDREGFSQARKYADDMLPVAEFLPSDVMEALQSGDARAVSASLIGIAEHIDGINSEYWDADFQAMVDQDVPGWMIAMSQGSREWTINGDDLADATWALWENSDWVGEELRAFAADLRDEDAARRLERAIQLTQESAQDLRSVLTGQ